MCACGRICRECANEGAAAAQVALSRSGDIFVSDGYCNSRVVQFTAAGVYIREYAPPEVRHSPEHSPAARTHPHSHRSGREFEIEGSHSPECASFLGV